MGPGFRNLGNTCFLNATLQCLSYLPPLAQHLLKGLYGQVGWNCSVLRAETFSCARQRSMLKGQGLGFRQASPEKDSHGALLNIEKRCRYCRSVTDATRFFYPFLEVRRI